MSECVYASLHPFRFLLILAGDNQRIEKIQSRCFDANQSLTWTRFWRGYVSKFKLFGLAKMSAENGLHRCHPDARAGAQTSNDYHAPVTPASASRRRKRVKARRSRDFTVPIGILVRAAIVAWDNTSKNASCTILN